jgi:hypothetical protein
MSIARLRAFERIDALLATMGSSASDGALAVLDAAAAALLAVSPCTPAAQLAVDRASELLVARLLLRQHW